MFQEELSVMSQNEQAMKTAGRGGITLPRGFRAIGLHCGVKKSKKDLALIVSDVPAVGAAVFTLNRVQAAPILVCKNHYAQRPTFRALVVNSGNANACTGALGFENAVRMVEATADTLKISASEVLVASTGVIGEQLPIERIERGIRVAAGMLSASEHQSAADAIMTTDTFSKTATSSFELDGVTVNIGGIAKGSGMIHPNMATMLGFITTDATFEPDVFRNLVKETSDKTFNRIVVDGDTSTNDMVAALANGESGIAPLKPGTSAYARFAGELEIILKKLALDIVRDGEGATKLVEITIDSAADDTSALKAAKTVALSPLVKTAIHGEDANWGRIIAAVGYSGIEFDPALTEIAINGAPILQKDFLVTLTNQEANKSLKGSFVNLVVKLHGGSGKATVWTCDFSEEYVVINGSYRS